MRRTLLLVPLALVLIGATTSACQPTGAARCDQLVRGWPARADIEAHGFTMDCTPGFDGYDPATGRRISAWTDHDRKTVWIWLNRTTVIHDDAFLIKTMAHEDAHVRGIVSECKADEFAYRYMKPREREGVGFLFC